MALDGNGEAIEGLWFATGPVEAGDELAIGGFDFDHCVAESGEITDPRVEEIIRAARQLCRVLADRRSSGSRSGFPPRTRSIKKDRSVLSSTAPSGGSRSPGSVTLARRGTLATVDVQTPRRLYERWIAGELRAGEAERSTRQRGETDPAITRQHDGDLRTAGVPVDQMVKVAKRCLKLLSNDRAADYAEWINVLCALKWVEEQTGADLSKAWHKFSRRCKIEVRPRRRSAAVGPLRGTTRRRATNDRLAASLGKRG